MNFAKTTAVFWSTARIATASMSFMIGSIADAQYCAPAVFVGDLNNDTRVDDDDVTAWDALNGSGGYTPCADLNRNGVLDGNDKAQLQVAVKIASPTAGGLGLQGRLPAFTISEFRSGQPFITDTQQRFVEFTCPESFPPNYKFSNQFNNGYYLLLVSKKNTGSPTNTQGEIRKVIPLGNTQFATAGLGQSRALLKDSTFSLPLPTGLTATSMPAGQSITFSLQEEFNTTWFLVYRRPTAGSYVSKVAIPAIGQRVDGNSDCQIDASYTNSSAPPPNVMPPWDVIIDAISVVRSPVTTGNGGRGCIYAHGLLFEAGPTTGAFGELEAPLHVYRLCSGPKELETELAVNYQSVTVGIDTPGTKNFCQTDSACGELSADSCTQVHKKPFCNDSNCCTYVCGLDSSCCTDTWDIVCADLAVLHCGVCGGAGSGSCLLAHIDGKACSDETCCELVCNSQGFAYCCTVGWDEDCVTKAKLPGMCLECGSSILPNSCYESSDFPYCPDAECCATVCIYWGPCCEVVWDQYCADLAQSFCPVISCGSLTAGDCCLAHEDPFCSDLNCCTVVCANDPFCCEVSWDVQCVEETILSGCGVVCACGGGLPTDTCFVVHPNPGCVSIRCCNFVCTSDPFCCGVTWDLSCVAAAKGFCGEQPNCETSTFSCLIPHDTPGCSSPACCDAVCTLRPECCQFAWDAPCVAEVPSACEGCGEPFAGNCLAAHSSPACNEAVCCEAVCVQDSYCCTTSWDETCVQLAVARCSLPSNCANPQSRSCFISSFLPGCIDPICCKFICETWDQYCCDVRWDAICADEAIISSKLQISFCRVPPAVPGRGDCSEVHSTRGCANYQCSAAVCSVRPICCNVSWDEDCVELVPYVCVGTTSCEDANDQNPLLSPFLVHGTPGTNDYACCNAVCQRLGFEYCCATRWDAACVAQANILCKYSLPEGQPWCVPASGSCNRAHSTPGCEDDSCASAVCFYNAQCCILEWDETCVALAGGICCGLPGCGNHCNGSCLIVHETPFCSDPFCCTAVCEQDPSCCEIGWDFYCVDFAYSRCARGCGIAESGSCRYPHKNPGCNNAKCCAAICEQDPFCCQEQWDSSCAQMTSKDPKCDEAQLTCGSYLGEYCCSVHLGSTGCGNLACCNAVCAADTFCCDVRWDETCVEEAFNSDACPCTMPCGDQCGGECCAAHLGPNCRDASCCNSVCALDPVCCETIWDAICAQSARVICVNTCEPPVCGSFEAGSCCDPHTNANCNNSACCDLVCATLPACCITSWDTSCAALSTAICPVCSLGCGSQDAGACYVAHLNPFCDDLQCCSAVCNLIPQCCSVAWDQECADFALFKICP